MIAIACMSQNFVIGVKGTIPWRIKRDFQWFKEQTLNKTILVGRNTFLSLPFLPNRKILILGSKKTENPLYDMQEVGFVSDPNEIPNDVIIAGGGEVYKNFLPYCDELLLTIIHKDYQGDTYFPKFEHLFKSSTLILSEYDAKERTDFSIWHYKK